MVGLSACERQSIYDIRLDAIRATGDLAKPVGVSLWLYPHGVEKELARSFVSEKISGTEWVLLESDFVPIPQLYVTERAYFVLTVRLNPNRLATPPDAVFSASLPLAELTGTERITTEVVLSALEPYELRLSLRSRESEK
jgi:hypothetical protein